MHIIPVSCAAVVILAAALFALSQKWCAVKIAREKIELASKYHFDPDDPDRN